MEVYNKRFNQYNTIGSDLTLGIVLYRKAVENNESNLFLAEISAELTCSNWF